MKSPSRSTTAHAAVFKRRWVLGSAAAAALAAFSSATFAQGAAAWPTRPLRMVVSFPAGGGNDIVARVVAQQLSAQLGQPVVVDNRAGAGGTLGNDFVAKAPADGYTLLLTPANFAITATLYRKLPYDPAADFQGVAFIGSSPNLLVVNPAVPARTTSEVIALARSAPGKLTFASSGVGGSIHLSAEMFKKVAGLDMLHVPYKGTAPAIQDLIGGQVQLMFPTILEAMPFLADGKLRPIAVTSAKRSALLPNVPSIQESAGIANLDFDVGAWFGISVRAGTPPAIVERLNREINLALSNPEVKRRLADQAVDTGSSGGTAASFHQFVSAEIARWGEVVRASGASAD